MSPFLTIDAYGRVQRPDLHYEKAKIQALSYVENAIEFLRNNRSEAISDAIYNQTALYQNLRKIREYLLKNRFQTHHRLDFKNDFSTCNIACSGKCIAFITSGKRNDIYLCHGAFDKSVEELAQKLIHEIQHNIALRISECDATQTEVQAVILAGSLPFGNGYIDRGGECELLARRLGHVYQKKRGSSERVRVPDIDKYFKISTELWRQILDKKHIVYPEFSPLNCMVDLFRVNEIHALNPTASNLRFRVTEVKFNFWNNFRVRSDIDGTKLDLECYVTPGFPILKVDFNEILAGHIQLD